MFLTFVKYLSVKNCRKSVAKEDINLFKSDKTRKRYFSGDGRKLKKKWLRKKLNLKDYE